MTTSPGTEAEPNVKVSKGWPRTALLSLGDKSGAVEFANALAEGGTRLIASGGTARHLIQAGLEVTAVETWTGFSDLLGGRVKTLHPHVHAPILARRNLESDMQELDARELQPIDLVAVALYAFEEKAPTLDEAGAIEEIDIGGVALLRAAAKNHEDVIVVHDPSQYPGVLDALREGVTKDHRRDWAIAAFERTSRYDGAIAADLSKRAGGSTAAGDLPQKLTIELEQVRGLRYGENPHQPAAVFGRKGDVASLRASREGKELSYNNMLDVEAAVHLVWQFERPACVIVKHNEPCGVATADTHAEAYARAFAADPLSAFGGIVAINGPLDGPTGEAISQQFAECVAASEVLPEGAEALKSKKNLRLLALGAQDVARPQDSVRFVGPWALLQRDGSGPAPEWKTVTATEPTPEQVEALRFAWAVAAAARSNAITVASGTQLIGLGSGQTSRVDAVDLALTKAKRAGHEVKGAVLASDGFFPFADNIEHAADAGIAAIVQPGGSKRDPEVIDACDTHGIAMMFTGRRTFRH